MSHWLRGGPDRGRGSRVDGRYLSPLSASPVGSVSARVLGLWLNVRFPCWSEGLAWGVGRGAWGVGRGVWGGQGLARAPLVTLLFPAVLLT